MKKKLILMILLAAGLVCLFAGIAGAELSTNLSIRIEYNKNNRKLVASRTYVDDEGNPVIASDKGYATIAYTYGTKNVVKKTEFLDEKGKPVDCLDGYCTKVCSYSGTKLTKTSYFDAVGNPAMGPEGYWKQEIKYNPKGKHLSTWEYDTEGEPVNLHRITEYMGGNLPNYVRSDSWYDAEDNLATGPEGYARVEYAYKGKNRCRTTYYGADGGLYYNAKAKYAVQEAKYEDNKIRELNYYDADGELTAGPDGYATAKYTYFNRGLEQLAMYYRADGSLYFTKDGYCGIRKKRGTKQRITQISYYSDEGVRGYCADGYSKTTYFFTRRGKIAYQRFYDDQDQLMVPPKIGYAVLKNSYTRRKVTMVEYFDEKNQPMRGPNGYAVAKHQYDNRRIVVETVYYDTDGKTVMNCKDGYARIKYEYDENKKCTSQAFFSADGERTVVRDNADELRYTWSGKKLQTSESYWRNGEPVTGDKGYHEVCMEYTGGGKVSAKYFLDTEGYPTESTDGYARIETLYNSKGKAMATLYYDANGELIATPGKEYAYVLTITKKERDMLESGQEEEAEEELKEPQEEEEVPGEEDDAVADDGDEGDSSDEDDEDDAVPPVMAAEEEKDKEELTGIIYIEYYGTDRKLMDLADGYARIIRTTDPAGRKVSEVYYDAEGQKAARKDGYDEVRWQYDSKASTAKRTEYYLDGKLTVNTATGVAVVCREFDEAGNTIREWYLGTDGEPVMTLEGTCARVERKYLDSKHILSEAWFDEKGNPATNGDTYVRIEREFDTNKNTIRETTYGADGKPIARKDGYDEIRRVFNDKNQAVTISFYLDGEPVLTSAGIATVCREYDEAGLVSREWYLGTDDKPIVHPKNQYACVEKTYLDKDHVLSEAWFDTEGNPMTHGDTYVRIERTFDGNKNAIRATTYGADGEPIARKDGYDEIRVEYNRKGQATLTSYFLKGEPVLNATGIAAIGREYDKAGLVCKEWYLGTDGELMIHPKEQYACVEKTYLDKKHIISEAWFDKDGKPMTHGDTYVRIEREYDERKNTVREVTYGADGKPVARKDGYDEVRVQFNEKNQAIRYAYWLNGELTLTATGVAVVCREFDASGNICTEWYLGDKGEMTVHLKNKYAKVERTCLDKDHFLSEAWFGADLQPITTGDTYVRIEREFDEKKNTIRETTYGADGNPIARKDGYDEVRREFNEKKQAIKIEYRLDGEPVMIKGGYAALEREYDERGNVSYERYFGTDLRPVLCAEGYGAVRKEYKGKKQVIHEQWFDTNEQPMPRPGDVYYGIRREYDENGLANVLKYYDENDQPTKCAAGYEMVWRRFNSKKQVNYETYMDHDSQPMTNDKGVYQTAYDYDKKGRVIREIYFDAEGQSMSNADGYIIVEKVYNKKGELTEERGIKPD